MNFKTYIGNVAYALDVFLNAVFLGDPTETISSRMGRHIKQGKCYLCRFLCGALDIFWPDHCINNIKKDKQ